MEMQHITKMKREAANFFPESKMQATIVLHEEIGSLHSSVQVQMICKKYGIDGI